MVLFPRFPLSVLPDLRHRPYVAAPSSPSTDNPPWSKPSFKRKASPSAPPLALNPPLGRLSTVSHLSNSSFRKLPPILREFLTVRIVLVESTPPAPLLLLLEPAPVLLSLPSALIPSSAALGVTERQIDPGRTRETKRRPHRLQIQIVHVENISQRMTRVRQQIRSIRVPRGAIQVIILLDETHQLTLDVGHLFGGEFVLVEGDPCGLEITEEARFFGGQEQQGPSGSGRSSGCTSHPMDVLLGIVRRIELYDPIDRGNVQPSRGHVGTAQYPLVGLAELKERGGTTLLLLPAVNVHDWDVDVIQQLRVEFDGIARRKEDHHLLIAILLEERKEEEEALVGGDRDVSLLQGGDRGELGLGGDLDVDGLVFIDGQPCQILHLLGLRGREQHGLPLLRNGTNNRPQIVLEPLLQYTIGLVHHQRQ
mmetsp:Transcript_16939/g.48947  ORF Transcript_16939/g.48947 Transcript_16939/m.48947 type:complete len:423 (+) Transcript_16939:355-1623(+)